MAGITFQKATKKRAKLRLALVGPAGSGKTKTALRIAVGLGGRIAVLDSEHGSASKYADEFVFDSFEPDSFSPVVYIEAIRAAEAAGYDVLIIDSLSHAWMGKDGALEMVDRAASRTQGNSFAGWKTVTPIHNNLIDAILGAQLHVIATMRSKTEYVIEKDERTGKSAPRKVGMAPVQRDGMEYEFDLLADLNIEHDLVVTKSRCPALEGAVIHKAGEPMAATLLEWLSGAALVTEPAVAAELRKLAAGLPPERQQRVEERIAAGLSKPAARDLYRQLKELGETTAAPAAGAAASTPQGKGEGASAASEAPAPTCTAPSSVSPDQGRAEGEQEPLEF